MADEEFFNLYHHGFIRVAACSPVVRVADPDFNVESTVRLARAAAHQDATLAIFPELGLSAYSNEDLFHQEALLRKVREAVNRFCESTRDMNLIAVIGAPLQVSGFLFNCGIVTYRGEISGVAVKTYLPNYREFYEARQFSTAEEALPTSIELCGQHDIPFGADLIFDVKGISHFSLFIELCEDVWVPIPPSSFAALAGATVVGNLSASNITIGKAEYRRGLISNQSARSISAYLYTAAGRGESTTDLAWDGHAVICENGTILAESERFSDGDQIIYADIDLDRLAQDRMRMTSFRQNARSHRKHLSRFRRIPFSIAVPDKRVLLSREVPRYPYVPSDPNTRGERCYEVYNIQTHSLAKRIGSSGAQNVVIGVSGGLDSTHALIVSARTMDLLHLPRSHVKAYTMPGFATTKKTYENALKLMQTLGVEVNEIDIKPSCMQMFKDIGHPFAEGRKVYDVTFENVQAGERTSHLFRIANLRNGLVVGTGDLSELALGWCTYGVGDHMSHYNVNSSVPKTLIQYIIRWVADTNQFDRETSNVLYDILDTEISPELIPGENGVQPAQKSEGAIGPYELQDFNNFYITRFGYAPTKVAFMAYCAWREKKKGYWPDVPAARRREYSIGEIRHWLTVYIERFFKTSQFKRSCIPNGPKVGSGGSLSPRGDYRAPSDSECFAWLENVQLVPEQDSDDR
ncbi:MAG: NAD(+) synthase [Deltaproteobacteria bacterium]|nr:NAD(+) synthase [Deltaproteobacteria bacterium]